MTFGAKDVQAAKCDYFLVLFIDDASGFRISAAPLLIIGFIGIDLVRLQEFARHEIGISAQQDVGAAAGHVSGYGHSALASSLRDDFRFTLVILGVEHVVRYSLADQA